MIRQVLRIIICITIFFPFRLFSQIPTKVFEITDILVDGCDGSNEGKNEMVLFQIGPNPINASDLRVDGAPASGIITTGVWPTVANPWLGIATPPAKPAEIASINSTIVNCGKLIEPVGGILPAGKKVLMITSTDFNPAAHNFSTLSDTLYVIFQIAGNTAGHFVNYGLPAATRTLVLVHVPSSGADTVIYDRSLLVMQNGLIGAQDGGAVKFSFSGSATYYNNGCQAPYTPLSAAWTATAICQSSAPLNLNTLITGTVGGSWSGTGVSGNSFNPSGLSGLYTITYTIGYPPCQLTESHAMTVNPSIVPTFATSGPYCVGATPAALPTTSTNSITGSWSPATINTAAMGTTTYTFTPTTGLCASTATMSVTVNSNTAPVFTALGPYCVGATAGILPATSTNSIAGTWSPSTISTASVGTTSYTFTPTAGQCASTATMSVVVGTNIIPTFAALGPYCVGATSGILPTTSINSITGTWNPATISTASVGTTVYSFTPTAGQCANATTMSVSVNTNTAPTFTALGPYCIGATPPVLQATSVNGINGTWSPAIVSTSAAGTTTYTFTPTAGQCGTTATLTIAVNSLPIADAGPDVSICPSSSATLSGSGGGTYNWSNGETTASITVTPSSSTIYTLTVSNNGCTASDEATVTVSNIATVILTPSNPSICTGASVLLSASGLNSYSWSPTADLSSSTGSSVTASPSSTTTYTVTGSDGGGCTGSATITVNVAPITVIASSTDEHCGQSNGTVSVNATGPCGSGFTYLWDTPSQQTLQNVSGLPAATYTVTVNCGACVATTSAIVSFINGPTVSVTGSDASCGNSNGSASTAITGGNGPYSYLWNCSPTQSTATMLNVVAGNYTVTVTDANNCSATDDIIIADVAGPSATTLFISADSCNLSTGSAYVNVTGGTAPFQFAWNSLPPQNTQALNQVAAGSYIVTVTDANGCSSTATVMITSIAGPSVTVTSTNEICGQSNGTATATASQGSGNYTYLWSTVPAMSTQSITNLSAGMYIVTVDDGICSVTSSVNVNNIEGPDATMFINPKVVTTLDGLVYFSSQTTGSVISWVWNYGDGTFGTGEASNHTYVNVGTYMVTLTVTDSYGCTLTVTDSVILKDIITLYIPNSFTPDNDGLNDFFYPQGINIDPDNYVFDIYDRWGNIVFHTTEVDGKWNGTYMNKGKVPDDCILDVYVYRVVSKNELSKEKIYIGKVILLK